MENDNKSTSLSFATFDDIFNHPDVEDKKKSNIVNTVADNDSISNKGRELYSLLQRQRLIVDEAAIHFISQPSLKAKRADARNSVFKLAQKYKAIPDSQNTENIKKMFGNVGGEEDDSGDEDWEPSYKKLPTILRERIKSKLPNEISTDSSLQDDLLAEMDKIENEADNMVAAGAVSTEEIFISEDDKSCLSKAFTLSSPTKKETNTDQICNSKNESDSEEEDITPEVLNRVNTLQREFIGNNLQEWYDQMQLIYCNGVKLVKVNAMGKKFIRLVKVDDHYLYITQPHTLSKVNIERKVFVLEIEKVDVGKTSKEFYALINLINQGKELAEFMPNDKLCASVHLANNRSVSLIFLKEDQRNGFVFFMRVLKKRATSAVNATKV